MGLLGLTLTAALAAGSGGLAVAGPSSGGSPVTGVGKEGPLGAAPKAEKVDDDLSSPMESDRRALRQKALDLVLTGERKIERINGSDVVRVGTKAAPYSKAELKSLAAGKAVKPREGRLLRRASREQTDKIFVVLAEFGDERAPGLTPTRTPTRRRRARRRSRARCTTRSRSRTGAWTTPRSGSRLQRRALPEPLLRRRRGRRVAQDLLREAVLGPLLRRRRGHRLGEGQVQRGPLRPSTTTPRTRTATPASATPTSATTPGPCCSDALTQWVADQKAAGRTDAQIKSRRRVLRPAGPLRLRRRRQLQRAGRLPRPLPDRPRRRRPGRRRPAAG